METGKKMNICADGATGLNGARGALVGERSVAWVGRGLPKWQAPGPKVTTQPSPCLVLDVVQGDEHLGGLYHVGARVHGAALKVFVGFGF